MTFRRDSKAAARRTPANPEASRQISSSVELIDLPAKIHPTESTHQRLVLPKQGDEYNIQPLACKGETSRAGLSQQPKSRTATIRFRMLPPAMIFRQACPTTLEPQGFRPERSSATFATLETVADGFVPWSRQGDFRPLPEFPARSPFRDRNGAQ